MDLKKEKNVLRMVVGLCFSFQRCWFSGKKKDTLVSSDGRRKKAVWMGQHKLILWRSAGGWMWNWWNTELNTSGPSRWLFFSSFRNILLGKRYYCHNNKNFYVWPGKHQRPWNGSAAAWDKEGWMRKRKTMEIFIFILFQWQVLGNLCLTARCMWASWFCL